MAAGAAWDLEVPQTWQFRRPLNKFSTTIFSPEDGAPFLQRPPFLQLGRRRLWSAAVPLSLLCRPQTVISSEIREATDPFSLAAGHPASPRVGFAFMRASHTTSLGVRDLRSSR